MMGSSTSDQRTALNVHWKGKRDSESRARVLIYEARITFTYLFLFHSHREECSVSCGIVLPPPHIIKQVRTGWTSYTRSGIHRNRASKSMCAVFYVLINILPQNRIIMQHRKVYMVSRMWSTIQQTTSCFGSWRVQFSSVACWVQSSFPATSTFWANCNKKKNNNKKISKHSLVIQWKKSSLCVLWKKLGTTHFKVENVDKW